MHSSICVVFCIIKLFQKTHTILLEGIKIFNDKITRKLPLIILTNWSSGRFKRIWSSQGRKGIEDHQSNMKIEKTLRMEELESGQQEMQEKIAQMTKMVTNLTKGKEIIDDLDLQRKPTSWKGGIDPSILPNLNNLCE